MFCIVVSFTKLKTKINEFHLKKRLQYYAFDGVKG